MNKSKSILVINSIFDKSYMHFIDGFVFLEDEETAPRKTIHQAINIMGEAVAKMVCTLFSYWLMKRQHLLAIIKYIYNI
jgi:hypothetical protein